MSSDYMKKTRWYPDTCNCVIEYEWDETLETPLHVNPIMIFICSTHQSSQDPYQSAYSENVLKNQIIETVRSIVPESFHDDGSCDIQWGFNEDQVLVLDNIPVEKKQNVVQSLNEYEGRVLVN